MSIESNKKDFEKVLKESLASIELLDHVTDDAILLPLKEMVHEYETHFKDDIEELMDKAEELVDKVKELESSLDGFIATQ